MNADRLPQRLPLAAECLQEDSNTHPVTVWVIATTSQSEWATQILRQHSCVGIDIQGDDLSPGGQICLVQVGCPMAAFDSDGIKQSISGRQWMLASARRYPLTWRVLQHMLSPAAGAPVHDAHIILCLAISSM